LKANTPSNCSRKAAKAPVLSACNDSLPIALGLYDLHRIEGPDRLVMLCDRARVIRRSDRPV